MGTCMEILAWRKGSDNFLESSRGTTTTTETLMIDEGFQRLRLPVSCMHILCFYAEINISLYDHSRSLLLSFKNKTDVIYILVNVLTLYSFKI